MKGTLLSHVRSSGTCLSRLRIFMGNLPPFPWTLQHIFNKQRKFDPENIYEKKLIFYWNRPQNKLGDGKTSQRIQV